MLRIKQRYLSIRISAQREAISKSTIASQEDGIGGRKNKDDKNDIDKDNVEDFSIPMLMNESSMDGIGGRQGKDDKNDIDKDDVGDFSIPMLMNESSMEG